MRSRKTEIYGGLRGCIQKVIHFMHKVIPRYPVESPVDKVDSQFLRQVFTAVSCGAGMRAKTWLGELRWLRRGNYADAARGAQEGGHLRFPPSCESPLSFSPNLAKIGERRPLRKGERQRIYSSAWTRCCAPCIRIFAGSDTFLLHRPAALRRRGIIVPRNPLAGYNARHLRVTLINRLYRRVRRLGAPSLTKNIS